jgi:hypothetical protein
MTKLSDTQSIILSAAAQRSDGNLLPLPSSLRGGAAIKVVTALLARDFAREEVTDLQTRADAALNTVWRNEPDGCAAGRGPEEAEPSEEGGYPHRAKHRARSAQGPRRHQAGAADRYAPPQGGRDHRPDRRGHRLAASQVRGAFAGALKKKLGLTVTSEKVEGGQRVYRIEA